MVDLPKSVQEQNNDSYRKSEKVQGKHPEYWRTEGFSHLTKDHFSWLHYLTDTEYKWHPLESDREKPLLTQKNIKETLFGRQGTCYIWLKSNRMGMLCCFRTQDKDPKHKHRSKSISEWLKRNTVKVLEWSSDTLSFIFAVILSIFTGWMAGCFPTVSTESHCV